MTATNAQYLTFTLATGLVFLDLLERGQEKHAFKQKTKPVTQSAIKILRKALDDEYNRTHPNSDNGTRLISQGNVSKELEQHETFVINAIQQSIWLSNQTPEKQQQYMKDYLDLDLKHKQSND